MFDRYFLKRRIIKLDNNAKKIEKTIKEKKEAMSNNIQTISEYGRQYNENKYAVKIQKLELKNESLKQEIESLEIQKKQMMEERNKMAKKFMLKDNKIQEVEVDEQGKPIIAPKQQQAQPPRQVRQPQQQHQEMPQMEPELPELEMPELADEAQYEEPQYNSQQGYPPIQPQQQQEPSKITVIINTTTEALKAEIFVEQLDEFMKSIIKVMENRIEDGIQKESILQVGTTLIAGKHIISVTIG